MLRSTSRYSLVYDTLRRAKPNALARIIGIPGIITFSKISGIREKNTLPFEKDQTCGPARRQRRRLKLASRVEIACDSLQKLFMPGTGRPERV